MSRLRFWMMVSGGMILLGALLFGCQVWKHVSFTPLADAGAVLVAAGIIVGLLKIRCPFCRRFLGIAGPVGSYCPFCGETLK